MADANDDGVISYSEWLLTAMNRNKMVTNDKLEAAFSGFDIDHSNTVSLDEITSFLFSDKHLTDPALKEILERYDSNNNGEITL